MAALCSCTVDAQTAPKPAEAIAPATTAKYGSDPVAGKTFVHDGVTLYYEVYGTGQPLLLVHGNGGSIRTLMAQIEYFRKHYQVIAMDSRDQGRSGDSVGPITYEKMTDDLAALLDHLKLPSVEVLGWSDGGIEALLLGIRHPEKVTKIAAMAANLTPEGAHPDAISMVKTMLAAMPPAEKETAGEKRERKVTETMLVQPQIPLEALHSIQAPTLILAGDHDLISDDHTLAIYHNVPNSELCIFPDATHLIPFDDPVRFNAAVDRFLRAPYVKKDRVQDALKSLEKVMTQ